MSLDLLIGLAIILATLVQLVRGSRRGRQQRPPAGRPRPSAGPGEPQGRQQAPRQTQSQDESFNKRLEEARRRVQEAMAGGEASSGEGPARAEDARDTLVMERSLPDIAESQRREAEESVPDTRPFEGAGARLDERREDRELTEAPPLTVQRTRRPKTARLSRNELVKLDPTSVYQGVIWHQILSDPLAKRSSRRKLSRRP